MRLASLGTTAAALFASLAPAALVPRQSGATSIYKLPGSGAWIESLAVRESGQVLLGRLDVPELWQLDPATKAASKLAGFGGALSVSGIAEPSPGVFAVVTGNFSTRGFSVTAGSWAVWRLDLTTGATAAPAPTLVARIPESGFLIGAAPLANSTVLVADAGKGALYAVDVATGQYGVVLQDASMKAPAGAFIQEGIHGLRYRDGYAYFTNTFGNTYSRVAVDAATAKASGAVSPILSNLGSPEDFALGPDGAAYIASMSNNAVLKVTPDGKRSTVASVSSPSSVAFGRTDADKNTLYVSTTSGSVFTVKLA